MGGQQLPSCSAGPTGAATRLTTGPPFRSPPTFSFPPSLPPLVFAMRAMRGERRCSLEDAQEKILKRTRQAATTKCLRKILNSRFAVH